VNGQVERHSGSCGRRHNCVSEISVIVPVYNVEQYIGRCIDSILNQSYKDFELIIVDDGSKDKSIEIVENNFCDSRIKMVHKENAGLPQARKAGLEASIGKYIVFVDADDWIEPQMLDILHKKIIENKADILCCGLQFEDNIGRILKYQSVYSEIEMNSVEAVKNIHISTSVYTYMWNKMFCRETLRLDDFPTGHFIGEDYCTMMNILKREYKIVHIEEILYHYVQHGSNMLKATYGESQRLAYNKYMELRPRLLTDYPEFKRIIVNYYFLEEMAIINSMIRGNVYDNDMKKEIFKDLRKNLLGYLVAPENRIVYKGAAIIMLIFFKLYKYIYVKFIDRIV
jgi:glycosyltransferase involved in cell wall biosynthesis